MFFKKNRKNTEQENTEQENTEQENTEQENIEQKNIEQKNKDLIEGMLKEIKLIDLSFYLKKNLSSYRSEALRNVHYYGNIRIKYIGFNISLLAFFLAYFAIYLNLNLSQLAQITSIWWIDLILILILLMPIFIYFILFIIVMLDKSYTTSFEHSNLTHYKVFNIDYPEILNKDCFNTFRNLIKEDKETLIKNDLKTLLLHYFYQANYKKAGEKQRKCLYLGIRLFFVEIVISLFYNLCIF